MITPGRILYKLYHSPVEKIRSTFRTGLRRTAQTNAGKKQMKIAAKQLSEIVYPDRPVYQVFFLTGSQYWYQTAFCLYSLQLHAGCNVHAVLVDDGSFDDHLLDTVKTQFPTTVSVVLASEIQATLDEKLPFERFPVLRQRRLVYPHLRKLTDIHVHAGTGPKLVLDSDMLFYKRPDAILDWLQNPQGFLFMRDVEESYGYSQKLMCELAGQPLMPEKLNVGVAGIKSSAIDWKQLEYWTKTMLEKEGSSYLQEQALTAMLAASQSYIILEANQYKVLPSIDCNSKISEILHHYVAESKYDYFVKGWRIVASSNKS